MARPIIKISDSTWVKGQTRRWPHTQESPDTARLPTDGPAGGNRNRSVYRMTSINPLPTDSMPDTYPGYNSGMDSYSSLQSSAELDSSRCDLLPPGSESTAINPNHGTLRNLSRMTKSRRGIIDSNRCKKYVYGVSKAGQVYLKKPRVNKSKGSMEFANLRKKQKKVEGGMTPRQWYSDRKVHQDLVEKGEQNDQYNKTYSKGLLKRNKKLRVMMDVHGFTIVPKVSKDENPLDSANTPICKLALGLFLPKNDDHVH